MTQRQRAALDAALRAAPHPADETLEQRRAGFVLAMGRELPAGTRTTATTLGGRPAVDVVPGGPTGDTREPGVLLYLHGGGYLLGSAETHAGLAAQLAQRAGVPAVLLDYRLAPEHPFPAAVDDALAAYRELLERGTSPARTVLAGDSAGAGLAVATLVAARRAGLPLPAAAVLFSPFADLTLSGDSIDALAATDPLFTRASLQEYVTAYLAGQDPADELASPGLADLHGLPPLLIQVGAHEVLLDDAVRLAARAGAADVDVTLEIVAGVPHVFQNRFGELDDADAALDRAGRFLTDHLPASKDTSPAPATRTRT